MIPTTIHLLSLASVVLSAGILESGQLIPPPDVVSQFKVNAFLNIHEFKSVSSILPPQCPPPVDRSTRTNHVIQSRITIWRPKFNKLSSKAILLKASRATFECYKSFFGSEVCQQKETRTQSLDVFDSTKILDLITHLQTVDPEDITPGRIDLLGGLENNCQCSWLLSTRSTHDIIDTVMTELTWSPLGYLVSPVMNISCLWSKNVCYLDESTILIQHPQLIPGASSCLLEESLSVPGEIFYQTNLLGGYHLKLFKAHDRQMTMNLDLDVNKKKSLCLHSPAIYLSQEGMYYSFATHRGESLEDILTRKERSTSESDVQPDIFSFPDSQRERWIQQRLTWGLIASETKFNNISVEVATAIDNIDHRICLIRRSLIASFWSLRYLNPYPFLVFSLGTEAVWVQHHKGSPVFKIGVPVVISPASPWYVCNDSLVVDFSIKDSSVIGRGLLSSSLGHIYQIPSGKEAITLQRCQNTDASGFSIPLMNGSFWVDGKGVQSAVNIQSPHFSLDPTLTLYLPHININNDVNLDLLVGNTRSLNPFEMTLQSSDHTWDWVPKGSPESKQDWIVNFFLIPLLSSLLPCFTLYIIITIGLNLLRRLISSPRQSIHRAY